MLVDDILAWEHFHKKNKACGFTVKVTQTNVNMCILVIQRYCKTTKLVTKKDTNPFPRIH